MQNILITGSSGFIGSNILLNIFNKHNIYITSRSKNSIKLKELKVIHYKNHLDLNKKLKKIKIDVIIHCGTHYVKNHNVSDINKLTLANIEFGVILLENLKSMGVKKFINFSTVWQNYNGKQDIAYNLYSAFKLSYSKILDYYIGKFSFIRFYNLFISDTYGENDNRSKIINLIKQNIRNKKKIRIVSKKLSMNLLNVKDIVSAVKIIVDKNVKPGKYNITNNKNIKIYNLIKKIKKVKKIKNLIKFENNSFKNDRIFYYKKLPGWQPRYSSFKDLIRFVLGQS
tara:strand:+ start:61 stop:912 length:852 start_codon:yes stop_codon:yes gene_type:complete